jgi:apolipoprotein N-acyltransferase
MVSMSAEISPSQKTHSSLLRREGTALALAVATVLLQFALFHPLNVGCLAVLAYVPWLLLMERRGVAGAALWGYGIGVGFFALGVGWIAAVDVFLWVLALIPLGLFHGGFALGLRLVRSRLGLPYAVAAPLLFTGMEFFRSFAASGFPWLYTGHAFHGSRHLLQTADLTSAYGLTFLALALNGLGADAWLWWKGRPTAVAPRTLAISGGVILALWAGAFVYGLARVGKVFSPGPRVFVVQGNIPQDIKLMTASAEGIWEKHVALTLEARNTSADLIIWPETMTPRSMAVDADELAALQDMAKDLDAHLLVGSTAYEPDPDEPGGLHTFNSGFFVSPQGEVLGRYDKMHLVPGGEYLPFRRVFPVVERVVKDALGYVPSVHPGSQRDVFVLPVRGGEEVPFCTVICYEIVFPDLVRGFVRDGARLVVNITNEGWFKESYEFEQMVAINKFRAVENRVSIVRAANTGISNVIDPEGRVLAAVQDPSGRKKAVSGVLDCTVPLDDRHTFYTRFGDVFAWLVFLAAISVTILSLLPSSWRDRMKRRGRLPSPPEAAPLDGLENASESDVEFP